MFDTQTASTEVEALAGGKRVKSGSKRKGKKREEKETVCHNSSRSKVGLFVK